MTGRKRGKPRRFGRRGGKASFIRSSSLLLFHSRCRSSLPQLPWKSTHTLVPSRESGLPSFLSRSAHLATSDTRIRTKTQPPPVRISDSYLFLVLGTRSLSESSPSESSGRTTRVRLRSTEDTVSRSVPFSPPPLPLLGISRLSLALYMLQFNSALGPYKGGLRLHPSVNLSILKLSVQARDVLTEGR